MIQVPPEHLLDTASDLNRASRGHVECMRQFKEFKTAVSQAIADREYSAAGLTLADDADSPAFVLSSKGRSLRFSFTPYINEGQGSGMITVHMLPMHQVEFPYHLGSLTFDPYGFTKEFVSSGPLNIGYGNAAMVIVHYYLMKAWQIGFAHPQSPLPR